MESHLLTLLKEPDILASLSERRYRRLERGEELIDLSMINPDLPPERSLLDRLVQESCKPENHRYAVSRGVKKLRDAFAAKYKTAFNVEIFAESETCVCMGSKDALFHGLMAVLQAGDRVLLGSPVYPAYVSALSLLNVEYDPFSVAPDEEGMLQEIEKKLSAKQYRILLLNFPHNPTGITVGGRFFERCLQLAKRHDLLVMNDFTYGEMTYDSASAVSLMSNSEAKLRAVEAYSLSKAYSVPGWRVGALVGAKQWIAGVSRLKSWVDYGNFLPIQLAASYALSSGEPIARNTTAVYAKRARIVSKGLKEQGWEVRAPTAGASVWARPPGGVRASNTDGLQTAYALLDQLGIYALPGRVFGAEHGEFLRFALVQKEEKIREALERLSEFKF